MTYCLPVRPMVTTRIKQLVPITMHSAVKTNLTLLARKESMARLTMSLKSMVFLAVSTSGVVITTIVMVSFLLKLLRDSSVRTLIHVGRGEEPWVSAVGHLSQEAQGGAYS